MGSTGKEWNTIPPDPPGIVHQNTQWVKVIDQQGFIDNVDWRDVSNGFDIILIHPPCVP